MTLLQKVTIIGFIIAVIFTFVSLPIDYAFYERTALSFLIPVIAYLVGTLIGMAIEDIGKIIDKIINKKPQS